MKTFLSLGLAMLALAALLIPLHSAAAPAVTLNWEEVLAGRPTRLWPSPAYSTDHTLYVTTDRDLRRSDDDGDHWTTLYPTLPLTESLGVSAFALDPAGSISQTLFLARNVPDGPAEVYRSSDSGLSWQTVFTTTAAPLLDLAAARDGANLFVFAVGGADVWRSADGGDSWQPADSGLPAEADLYRLFLSPTFAADHTLYLTGFGPLYRSTNGGDSWQVIHVPEMDVARHVVFSPHYAQDQTLWVSYFWIEGHGEYPPNGVLRSTDGGANWQVYNDGLPVDWPDGWIMGLGVAPNNAAIYAVERMPTDNGTTWNLFRSTTAGDHWIGQGLAPDATPNGLVVAANDLLFLPTQAGLWRLRQHSWEWVVNGDAESANGWEFPITPATAGYSTEQAHGGDRSIRVGIIGGANQLAYSSARQRVSLPAEAISSTLSFWLYPVSTGSHLAEPLAAAEGVWPTVPFGGDAQYLLLMDDEGNILETLLWLNDNSQSWQPYTFDLSDYQGESVWLHFGVYNDGLDGIAGMYVDDVSLLAAEPVPLPLTERLFLPLVRR